MKPRFLLLPLLTAVFAAVLRLIGMPIAAALFVGMFCGGVSYFFFVVLKVQRLILEKLRGTSPEEAAAHQTAEEAAREIARCGIVLLKNEDNLLPLPKRSRLNLVGLRAVQMCYNGGGSAASDESKCVTLEKALEQTGFEVNRELLNVSYNHLSTGQASISTPGKNRKVKQGSSQKGGAEFIAKPGSPVKPELPAQILKDTALHADGRTILSHARDFSPVAMVVLSRGGGEGYDFDPADLRLLDSERQLLTETCRNFEKVILILNTANTVEMGWLTDFPQIKAVLWVGFPGTAGNLALGDILCGDVCPSGHLPDTWAASNLSTPAANNFCQMQPDGTWSKQSFHYTNAPDKKGYFVHYSEGIYVGYRYFETRAAVDPAFDYGKEVVWPFGFGLSYTTFDQKIINLEEVEDALRLTVQITNSGSAAGRAVVQCYSEPPYTGKLEKSTVNLVSFCKTGLLQPDESTTITLDIPQKQLASFDAEKGTWVLEAGEYGISIRSDAHTVLDRSIWSLPENVEFSGTASLFADADTDSLTRAFDPAHKAFTGPVEGDFTAGEAVLAALDFSIPNDSALALDKMPVMGKNIGIHLTDMKDIPKDDSQWDAFVQQLTLAELCDLCGNGAWQTVAIPRLGIPATKAPDGSTCIGASVFTALAIGSSKAGITWPCPSILAASFDTALAKNMGSAVGTEANVMGYQGWYAPAMNCHRTAFNSRNFEYYSEDPLLSGKNAAAVVAAVQSHKVIPYIKHFALNERETNVRNQLFTWCSEQAMREIYLKPFELAIREGGALAVMSSFNYIGHTWAGGSKALLTKLLREEWGFEGTVITDACLYPYMKVDQMVYAGGDLSLDTLGAMSGGNGKRKQLLAVAQDPQYQISMARYLQRSAKNILYMVSKTI